MSSFLEDVSKELAKARSKHSQAINTPHEGYAVVLEEVDEFWDEVRAQFHDKQKMYKELVQIAAMCARTAEDCELGGEK